MWKEFNEKFVSFKFNKKFSLSQQIVILISLVVCVALLPASLFTTYRVSKVIYDRVSINAVSINNILCNSEEIQSSLIQQNASSNPSAETDAFMTSYVNEVDHSDEAGVAIYDKHHNLRVMYNPGNLPNFEESARSLIERYALRNTINWRENYNIPNKALGFVRDTDRKSVV